MRKILLFLALLTPLHAFASSEWINIDSKIFGVQRSVLVDLPETYAAGGRRYPVLYVTDATLHVFHTAATAKALSDGGRSPEMIVVGIRNDDRVRELTPTRVAQATVDGGLVRFPNSGGAPRLLAFIETELIPEIDRRFRTEPFRVLSGHSFGGMFALDTLFTRPTLFDAVIAISPTVWWDNKYLLRRAQQFLEGNPPLDVTVLMAVGKEFAPMNQDFEELRTALAGAPKGLTLHTFYFEEEDHFSTAPPATYSALRRLFAPWFFKIEGDPTKLWSRAQAHAQSMSRRYGYNVPIPEERGNQIGYTLLRAKHPTEAVEVFKAVAALYPSSPNAHDSLGDAYEAAGDTERAWQSYERAVQMALTARHPMADAYQRKLEDFKRRNPTLFPVPIRRP